MNLLTFILFATSFLYSSAINIVLFEEYQKNLSNDDISVFRNDINNEEIQNLNLEPKFYNNVIVKRSSNYNNLYYFESGNFQFETPPFHSYSKCVDEAVRQARNYGVLAVINFKHYMTDRNTVICNGKFLHAK